MVQKKKIEAVEQIAANIREAKSAVFVDYHGLTVAEANDLRARCREANVRYRVVKNRLAKRAYDAAGVAPPERVLRGPTAIAFGLDDPTTPARILAEFAKDNEHITIKGGFLGDEWLDVAAVEQLAKIPPRDQLLARLLGSLRAPLTKLVWVLRAPLSQLTVALKAVAEQKTG